VSESDHLRNAAGQVVVLQAEGHDVVAVDSAYHVAAHNRDRDIVVTASYSGVLPARFLAEHRPLATIGLDCAVGPQGASIAGLWYLEALGVPAAAVDVTTVLLGDAVDVWNDGVVSFVNQPARDRGVEPGLSVRQAARLILDSVEGQGTGAPRAALQVTNRAVVLEGPSGRQVICTDSIAFGREEDRDTNVLVTAGHTGRSAVPYLEKVAPLGFICSDGGMGRENSGVAALEVLAEKGIPGAAVDARLSRMGDALSSWETGVISAVSSLGYLAGVRVGMTCREAAQRLVEWNGKEDGTGA
jgi:hypothetical protein